MPMMTSQDSFVAEVTFKCNFNLDSLAIINTFLTNVPNLYPLKIPENPWFSGIFKVVWNGNIDQKWVDLNISWIFKVNQRKKSRIILKMSLIFSTSLEFLIFMDYFHYFLEFMLIIWKTAFLVKIIVIKQKPNSRTLFFLSGYRRYYLNWKL